MAAVGTAGSRTSASRRRRGRGDRRLGVRAHSTRARSAPRPPDARFTSAVHLRSPPFVVELVPEANVGELEHGLAALWPGADGIRVTETAVRSPCRTTGRSLVVRDAARHPWQRELIRRWPEAIVVETGPPIETHGAGRVNLAAAIEVLSSPVRVDAARLD